MIDDLLNKFPIISDQVEEPELKVILRNLVKVLENSIAGDVVEMGCYVGTTSLFISRVLKNFDSNKEFHVYDSFSGLPEKTSEDSSPAGEQFKPGELSASKKQFIENYKKSSLPLPLIHKNWFDNLQSTDMPDQIAFAFLDGDYYGSIKSCLSLIEDKMMPGGVIIIDDYQNESLPGARKATDEWVIKKNLNLQAEKSLAIINIPKQ